MAANIPDIQISSICQEFNSIREDMNAILKAINDPNTADISEALAKITLHPDSDAILKIAFIGQYSAGKSTIISALTGNRAIKIGADITTNTTTSYRWNGVEIIDTPGIGTERQDHDDITYQKLEECDLLIFCTTHMLFDSRMVQHFKKLAYQQRYSHKMMLVVNKLSSEAGDENERIANYRASLEQMMQPDSLSNFSICFIDAKDYCEGIDESDDELIELSRFPMFIDALNQLVRDRGKLAQLDTPIRQLLGQAEAIENLLLQSSSPQDQQFLEITARLLRRIRHERLNLKIAVQQCALEVRGVIRGLGYDLVNNLQQTTKQSEIEQHQKKLEIDLETQWNRSETQLEEIFKQSVQDLKEEVEEVFSSPIFAEYEVILEANYGSGSYSTNPNQSRFSIPYRLFSSLADELGVKVGSMAIRNFMKIPGGTESLRHADVVGSSLHHLILKGGKLIGFKFRPWQAVGLAKNMGNIARFAGPVVGIIVVLFEIVDQVQQTKKEKELCEMQNKIDREFATMADEVARQMHEQRQGFEDSVFDYLELKVKSSRDQYIEDMNKKQDQQNSQIQQIKSIQRRLDQLIDVLRKYMSR